MTENPFHVSIQGKRQIVSAYKYDQYDVTFYQLDYQMHSVI